MSDRNASPDVVVIGAGPAGSTAAIELARAGRSVVLTDAKVFPREKVCGGCLSGPALHMIRELLPSSRPLPGIPSTRITFIIGTRRLICDPRGATWIALRSELDECLATQAAEAGADVRFGHPARLERGSSGWVVVIGDDRITGRIVLLATGVGGLVRTIGIEGRAVRRPMIAQQWFQPTSSELPQPGEVEMHWLRGGYVGLATTNDARCNVALACDAKDAKQRSAFEYLRSLNADAAIWSMLPADAPRQFDAKGAAGFPWIPRRLGDANLLLIGDAAGYAEPFSGEGIAQAMHSARCAARAVMEGGEVLRYYERQLRQRHQWVRRRTRIIGNLLRTPLVHALAARRPILPDAWLASLVERVHVSGSRRPIPGI